MASSSRRPTSTEWTSEFDTLRRERLFRNPPKDHTAYPALVDALHPHVDSFNALFDHRNLLGRAMEDIGTKVFLDKPFGSLPRTEDGSEDTSRTRSGRNRFLVRIAKVILEKSVLPAANKISTTNREIFPAECRERHATYRGKLRAQLEYKLNDGAWQQETYELGHLPIMVKTSRCHLEKYTPAQLVQHKEEEEELGG